MELKPRRNRIQLAVLLLPGVLVFAMFTIYPIVKLLYMSFLEWNRDNMFEHSFAGLSNYAAVLSDATFRTAFANTLIYTLVTVPGQMVLGLLSRDLPGNLLPACHNVVGHRFAGVQVYF